MIKLTDLKPVFVDAGGEGVTNSKTGEPVPHRSGVGIAFDCPCGCTSRCFLYFENPMDGKPFAPLSSQQWKRIGENFETMTLKPSIFRSGGCGWHGYLTNGELKEC